MNLISRVLLVVLLLVLSAVGGITLGKLLKPAGPTVVPPIEVPADKGPSPEGKDRSPEEKRKDRRGQNKGGRDQNAVTSEPGTRAEPVAPAPVEPAPPPPPSDDDDDDDDDEGGGDD